jgi:hypothetical protein
VIVLCDAVRGTDRAMVTAFKHPMGKTCVKCDALCCFPELCDSVSCLLRVAKWCFLLFTVCYIMLCEVV